MELDVSESNETYLHDLSPVAWTSINLNQNHLRHISWDHLPISLKIFSASRNELKHIDMDMPFPSLETLLLNKNFLRSFRIEVVLNSLQTLDISQNWLGDLQFLQHLPNVKHLNLSYNDFEVLEYLPRHLETLVASHCKLKMIQNKLPSTLKELNLSYNALKQGSLPRSWGSLEKLTLCFNQLKKFPKYLPDTLKHLNLVSNQIEDLPSKLPSSLQMLNVSQNRIRFIPSSWNRLHILKIDSNQLTQDFTNQTPSWITHFWAENNWNLPEHHSKQSLVKQCWKRYLLKKRLRHIYRSRHIYNELLMVTLHPDHILQTDVFSPGWFS